MKRRLVMGEQKKGNGKFKNIESDWSMIPNEVIQNKNLSLKAKGLYCLIRSYITMGNFNLYQDFLRSRCKEKSTAFDAAWKELKDAGYLIQHKIRKPKGNYYYEYELLSTVLNEKPESEKSESEKPESKNPEHDKNKKQSDTPSSPPPENLGVADEENQEEQGINASPPPENPPLEKLGMVKADKATPRKSTPGFSTPGLSTPGKTGSITKVINKTINNKTLSIISIQDVRRQINYDNFNKMDRQIVDNIVDIFVEIMNMDDSQTLRIESRDVSVTSVKKRYKLVNHEHIEYILLRLRDATTRIGNIKFYIITMLYNAPSTMSLYFQNRVNSDMYSNAQ
jgi:hypothetical protein